MANNQKWSGRLNDLQDRVDALEKVNVLSGYGKAFTLQAEALREKHRNESVIMIL